MEYRYLGNSGFKVPALGFGAGTFGGKGPLFSAWGNSGVAEATRLVDVCLEAGVSLFDTADVYSDGESERVLGAALKGRRDQAIVSTKLTLRTGDGPNDVGASRHHLLRGIEGALRRLDTDYIDLLQLHHFDAMTPVEQVMATLDQAVRSGKVRYIGVSNFSGWQLAKSQAVAERYGYARYVAHQAYYSLIGRDYEWDLMPAGLDQGVGAIVWSPLGWGRLTGRIRRGAALPDGSRLHDTAGFAPPVEDERLYWVIDALEAVAAETGRSIPQVAINWLLRRPTVSSVLIGARNESQLRDNLGAVGWMLSDAQMERLDQASRTQPPYPHYPYWNGQFAERKPPPVCAAGGRKCRRVRTGLHPPKRPVALGTSTFVGYYGPMKQATVTRGEATKAAILQVARERFASEGYERTTIRAVAADAQIDPAMVIRYFGNKEGLFAAAAEFDLRIPTFEGVPVSKRGRALVTHFLDRWEGDDNLKALLRAAATNPQATDRLKQLFARQLVPAISRLCVESENAKERVGLIASQAMGLAMVRYVFKLPPVVAMTREQLIEWLAPTFQRYLTGKV